MSVGKSIRVYLADGTVSGIRHGEVANWTGQAIACPRRRFAELKQWDEVRRPGVYFLYGVDEETGQDQVYIGEAEIVADRLSNHVGNKDFWGEVIAFTSKDENLTKGHVRYLESRLVQLATDAKRDALENTARPQLPSLPRADRDAMEEFLDGVRLLLGVLGHKTLEPLVSAARSGGAVVEGAGVVIPAGSEPLTLASRTLKARALQTDEGIVVLAGSEAVTEAQPSISAGYRALREKLIAQGILVAADGKMRFTQDQLFSSPSQAACVVVGHAINGRDAWRTSDGRTLSQLEAVDMEKLKEKLGL